MQPSQHIQCGDFPCPDVRHERCSVPGIDVDAAEVRLMLISECAAEQAQDDYYAAGTPLFAQTTLQAFEDAGFPAVSIEELVKKGIYFTTAVKCAKTDYVIPGAAIKNCSRLLADEMALFPNVRAYLLMGDCAIKAFNYASQLLGEKRVIPAGSTYKIRSQPYTFRGRRSLPSYLQAGASFFIEKSKRRMIAEDITEALRLSGY